MTTKLKKVAGTFSTTGASSKVHGREVVLIRSGGGTGTIQLRVYDPVSGQAVVEQTLTSDDAVKGSAEKGFDWDVNCSAHTSDMEYILSVTRD